MSPDTWLVIATAASLAFGVGFRPLVWDVLNLKRIPRRLKKLSKKKNKKGFFRKIRGLVGGVAPARIGLSYIFGIGLVSVIGALADVAAPGISHLFLVFMEAAFMVGGVIGLSPKLNILGKNEIKTGMTSFDLLSRVEAIAVRALIADGSKPARKYLLELARKKNKDISGMVVEEVVAQDIPWAGPFLATGLRHSNPDIRKKALDKLIQLDHQLFEDQLPKLLEDPNPQIRKFAIENIDSLTPEKAMPLLRIGSQDNYPNIRAEAVHAAQRIRSSKKVNLLQQMMENPETVGHRSGIQALQEELKNGSWQSVKATRTALESIRDWETLRPLVEAIQAKPDQPVLISVLHHLGNRTDKEAMDAMLLMLTEKEDVVRETAITSLENKPELLPELVKKIRNSQRTEEIAGAIRLLAKLDQPKAYTHLVQFMNDKSPAVREYAVWATLGFEADERLLNFYKKVIKDPALSVRQELYRILTQRKEMRLFHEVLLNQQLLDTVAPIEVRVEAWKGNEENDVRKYVGTLLRESNFFHTPVEDQFCTRCNTRVYEEKVLGLEVPLCRLCRKPNAILPNIHQVTGIIGPSYGRGSQQGNGYRIDLWNEKTKQIRYADIEVLEIQGGGNFDYDWAVNATLEVLRNGSAPSELKFRLIETENPNLSANTRRLLKEVTSV